MSALFSGFFLGLSLIMAIGAQNAFVLRQGLRGDHVFAICLVCALSDAALIAAGVNGFAALTREVAWLEPVMRLGGAAFLFAYGLRSFAAAWREGAALMPAGGAGAPFASTLLTCLALTWLNPHVYLDTMVLIGSVATQFPGHTSAFALGAASASFLFFFGLGYGARLLRPVFARPGTWRILEAVVGALMWTIALRLVLP